MHVFDSPCRTKSCPNEAPVGSEKKTAALISVGSALAQILFLFQELSVLSGPSCIISCLVLKLSLQHVDAFLLLGHQAAVMEGATDELLEKILKSC